jgi:hypothetical protein
VAERACALGLRFNISTRPEDTITSNGWFDFLASSRATIGCESGSSALDRRGEIQARIRWVQQRNPDMSFDEVSREMSPGWDNHRFFALGPRHLEAVITRTCQILVEGDYDGVLQPHRHYIPLRRDLGNLDEVLHMVRDHALIDQITARAYEEIYLSGRYSHARFAEQLEQAIENQALKARLRIPWWMARLALQTGLATYRAGRGAWCAVSRPWPLRAFDERIESSPFSLARLWRPVLYCKIARLLLREPLLRDALIRGWHCGIARPLARDLLKLLVLRRLVTGGAPDPLPFRIRWSVSSASVRIESVPSNAEPKTEGPSERDWSALKASLASGEVHRIEWDHSRIRAPIRYQAGSFRGADLWFPAGEGHAFNGLRAFGCDDADRVVTLLQYAAPSPRRECDKLPVAESA